jgi:carboxyl-terminal processing protease
MILLDSSCFSATDIFLGAFKGWKNVTLMGSASGGGSGRPHEVKLPYGSIHVKLSTMASFQPVGKLYDGRGISPDVDIPTKPSDIIGRTDSVLDVARRRLH